MKKCSRCGTDILSGQLVCPHCGKRQRQSRRVRCRHCGTISRSSLEVCPGCGEPLRHDWLRPLLIGAVILAGAVLGLMVGPWLIRGLSSLQPSQAVSTVQSMAEEVPVFIDVPTLTPSLTPSITPSPTTTPSPTPTPSNTPTPTLTPTPTPTRTPTPTDTPSPTPTKTRRPATPTRPTDTPTPLPTVAPPTLLEPADGSPFGGDDIFKLVWTSSHTLKLDECYLVTVRYTHQGGEARVPICTQETFWWVPESLYLQADQETDRVYHWSVRLARKGTDDEGQETLTPFSPASEEWSFFWR